MKNRMILQTLMITFVSLLLFAVVTVCFSVSFNNDTTKKDLQRSMQLYENRLQACQTISEVSDTVRLAETVWDLRITMINLFGKVLFDSNATTEQMEDHTTRAEFVAAMQGKTATEIRYSKTMRIYMMYHAKRITLQIPVQADSAENQVVLRVAIPTVQSDGFIVSSIVTMLIVMIVALVVACLIARRMYRHGLKPYAVIGESMKSLSEGTYQPVLPHFNDNEINEQLLKINDISEKINLAIEENKREKQKLQDILDHMGQGLLVVDDRNRIALINRKASELFERTATVGCDLYQITRNESLIYSIKNAQVKQEQSAFDFTVNGQIYSVTVMPVVSTWAKGSGKIVILHFVRVTEVRAAEKSRSEFFANASHELKTPLTSIKGFAELIAEGMVKNDKEVIDHARKISHESERMLSLIEDMLKISKSEASSDLTATATVVWKQLLEQIVQNFEPQAAEKQVQVTLCAKEAVSSSNEQAVHEIVSNLLDNAIQYNRIGGEVRVLLESTADSVVVTVKDTGIGIPQTDQTRIFERFYRVDKGRSRASGGTGLGLSIVKHLCGNLGAKLTLTSELHKGTTVTVVFPKI